MFIQCSDQRHVVDALQPFGAGTAGSKTRVSISTVVLGHRSHRCFCCRAQQRIHWPPLPHLVAPSHRRTRSSPEHSASHNIHVIQASLNESFLLTFFACFFLPGEYRIVAVSQLFVCVFRLFYEIHTFY